MGSLKALQNVLALHGTERHSLMAQTRPKEVPAESFSAELFNWCVQKIKCVLIFLMPWNKQVKFMVVFVLRVCLAMQVLHPKNNQTKIVYADNSFHES